MDKARPEKDHANAQGTECVSMHEVSTRQKSTFKLPTPNWLPALYGGTTRDLLPVTRPNDEGPDLDNDLGCLVHTDSSV